MSDTPKINDPVFVVGVPRSGTTLVRLILNAHSCIAIGPETHFFKQVWLQKNYYGELSDKDNLLRLWDEYTNTKYFDDFGFEDKEIVKNEIFDKVKSYKKFLRVLLQIYAKNNNKIIWGEKTPEHLFDVIKILEWYPGAKLIHVIRDPRSVCASLAKVPWASEDAFSNARVWNRYLSFAEKLNKGEIRDSVMEVYYEDLIIDTEATLKKICHFIDVEFEPGMLYFYKDSSRYVEKDEPWKDNVLSPLNADSINKWKEELSLEQQKDISIKARKLMLKHGYLHSGTAFDRVSHLFSSIYVHLKWAVRRFLFHVREKLQLQ